MIRHLAITISSILCRQDISNRTIKITVNSQYTDNIAFRFVVNYVKVYDHLFFICTKPDIKIYGGNIAYL